MRKSLLLDSLSSLSGRTFRPMSVQLCHVSVPSGTDNLGFCSIRYGPRSNDDLLRRYVMLAPNNPDDIHMIDNLLQQLWVLQVCVYTTAFKPLSCCLTGLQRPVCYHADLRGVWRSMCRTRGWRCSPTSGWRTQQSRYAALARPAVLIMQEAE